VALKEPKRRTPKREDQRPPLKIGEIEAKSRKNEKPTPRCSSQGSTVKPKGKPKQSLR